MKRLLLVLLLGTLAAGELVAEDGYRLWLRYDRFLWKKVRKQIKFLAEERLEYLYKLKEENNIGSN